MKAHLESTQNELRIWDDANARVEETSRLERLQEQRVKDGASEARIGGSLNEGSAAGMETMAPGERPGRDADAGHYDYLLGPR